MTEEKADGIPDEEGVFRGLAQAPLHFHDAVAELIDNAIAEKEEDFTIEVDISSIEGSDRYEVTVSDDGPGISLNELKNHVFKTGKPPLHGRSNLREHGFGLKNVLAKIQTFEGPPWKIWTRDQEVLDQEKFYFIEGPLRFKIPIQLRSSEWPDFGPESTGTVIQFSSPLSYLQTVSRGIKGAPPSDLDKILGYLREHLGVFYRGYWGCERIGKRTGKSAGTILTSLNSGSKKPVRPIEPDYGTRELVKKFSVNTPRGEIEIEGEFGKLETESKETKQRKYYYRPTQESQGVDVRIGKRVMATRLLTEIWGIARHPSYNQLWGEFRIISDDPAKFPRTLNNKTSLDFDDDVWKKIATGICGRINSDALPKKEYVHRTEPQLRQELAKRLSALALSGDKVRKDYSCFGGSGVAIDILFDRNTGEKIIYETKSGKTHPLDVYQLRMYWDGLVKDGYEPTGGILVGDGKGSGVPSLIDYTNRLKDQKGNSYHFEFKEWKDLGIKTKK